MPVLQSKEAMKMKKHGSRMKTYAQAIGLKSDETLEATKNGKQPKDKNKQGKDNNNNKKKNSDLENAIKDMKEQTLKLKQIIEILCTTIQDEKVKNKAFESLNQIKQSTPIGKVENLNHKPLEQEKERNRTKISKLTALNKEIEHDLKKKGNSGKRKERPPGTSYNSNEDEKAGTSSNNYYEVGLEAVNRRKTKHLSKN